MIIKMDNEEESNDVEQEAEPMTKTLKILLFCESMKRLSPHQLSLKGEMKDCIISYTDLLSLDLIPTRYEKDVVL